MKQLLVSIVGVLMVTITAGVSMAEMEIKRWNPEGLSQPVGYSQLVTVTGAKKLIYMGGKAGIYPDDTFPAGLAEQAELTFKNIDIALKAAGATRENVVNIEIFVVDLANIDPTPLYQAVRDYFPLGHKPTSMVIGVSALAYPGLLVEISVTAATQ